MKIFSFLDRKKKQSDFAEFFSKPIKEQKKVIRSAVREANKEQRELYQRYQRNSGMKTL